MLTIQDICILMILHIQVGGIYLFLKNKKEQFHDSIFLEYHILVLLIMLTKDNCSLVNRKS